MEATGRDGKSYRNHDRLPNFGSWIDDEATTQHASSSREEKIPIGVPKFGSWTDEATTQHPSSYRRAKSYRNHDRLPNFGSWTDDEATTQHPSSYRRAILQAALSSWELPRRAERRMSGYNSHTSNTTSSTGTIVSTATSTGSRFSSVSLSMETAMHFEFDLDSDTKEQIKQITSLVQEFSMPAGPGGALERWFAELGVTWVLHLGDAATATRAHAFDNASSWIGALAKITEIINLMANPKTISLMQSSSLCSNSDRGSVAALPSIWEKARPETANGKEDRFQLAQFIRRTMTKVVRLVLVDKEQVLTTENSDNTATIIQFQCQFAQLIRETMLKMLAFVDAVFAPAEITREDLVGDWSTYKDRLNALLGVRDALSSALTKIQHSFVFLSQPRADAQVKRTQGEIVSLLSAAESKADEAILTRLEQARNGFLELLLIEDEDGDRSSSSCTPAAWQGSSEIHEVSRHVMGYVTFIQHHYRALNTIVSKAALYSLQTDVVSFLQEYLASKSELFPDQSLRFLFLINNLYFILGKLTSDSRFLEDPFNSIDVATFAKPDDCIDLVPTLRLLSGYLESYIQVSWSPLLACRFTRRDYSQMSTKFESEFQKIYTSQKHWKVPDPRMRKMLRQEIIRRIIPGYPTYLKDDKATTPKIMWWDLEDMLQQLFEG